MKMIGAFFGSKMGQVLVGLTMVVILDGCVKIRVASNVGDCPTGTKTGTDITGTDIKDNDPTGCNKSPHPNGDAFNFKNKETGQVITDHNHICNGSVQMKCLPGNFGTCTFRGPLCKQNFYPTTSGSMGGKCDCECT